MRCLKNPLVLAGILALFSAVSLTQAQTGGPTRTQFEQMTDQNLPAWLRALGYTVDEKANLQGQRYWNVQSKQSGATYIMELAPYRNTTGQITGFWLIAKLGNPFNPNQPPPAQALLNILEKNHTIVPYFFSYHKASGYLCLNCEHPYATTNQAELSTILNSFLAKVRDTQPVWSLNQGSGSDPVAGANKPGVVTWSGSETLENFGKLTFQLDKAGKATMIDAQSTTTGTWSQNGNQMTITFPNCVYQGTLTGTTLSGTARAGNGQTWTFRVTRPS